MSQTATRPTPRVPPEETFWKHYSPHHEFPLSTVTSIGLHFLIVPLLLLIGYLAVTYLRPAEKPVDVDAIALEPQGGGGGSPKGVGPGPGIGAAQEDPIDDVIDSRAEVGDVPREQLKEARRDALKLPEVQDAGLKQFIEEGGRNVDSWVRLAEEQRNKLRKGLAAGKGEGGPGSGGGGPGTGHGPGSGDAEGPGKGTGKREKRVLRWTMIFNTQDGNDYARQLAGLGAILAVPDPNDATSYLVIRNLSDRPVRPKAEDLAKIQRIYWIDDKPSSVRSLSAALGLDPEPPHIVAFFPVELEQKLLKLELSYRNRTEDEIKETRFEIRRHGDTYQPWVVSQR
jgi:hypothetical protein